MNKEVKDLIDILKEYADGFTSVLAPTEESVKVLLDYINQLEKGSYIEEGINGQWTNWKFEAENYKRVCDGLYKRVNQLELDVDSYKNKYENANRLYLDTSKKLKQLETNRDEAIKKLEEVRERRYMLLAEVEVLEILKGGSNE